MKYEETLKLALEALKELTECGVEAWGVTRYCVADGYQAIKAIEEALSKQEHGEQVVKEHLTTDDELTCKKCH